MAPTVLKGLEHHALFLLLVQICVLLGVARVLGEVMRALRQPPVVGELLAGVLLGPTTFGLAFPELQAAIFPAVQSQADLLAVVAWLGVLSLLVVTGLETDIRLIVQKGGTALLISAGGIIVPFATGLALGWMLPEGLLTSPERRSVFALFMAVAMSISAVPVIAKVLFDLKLVRRDIGQLTLAAAMTDDTIGWILLSVVAGLASRGSVELSGVAVSVGAAVVFLALALTVGGPIVAGVLTIVDRLGTGVAGQFSVVLVLAFGAAAFTQEMGIEAVLGAFVVGILVGQAKRFKAEVSHTLELVTAGFLAPIFFASAGLKVDLVRLLDPEIMVVGSIVLFIACLGKMVGCYLGAWAGGLSHWERLALGSGMNARGAMEIIVATVGLGLGVLTAEMYSVIVMVAIVTSLMAPPLLRWTLSHIEMSEEETQRLERESLAATSFARSIRRVLIVARDEEQAELISGLMTHLKSAQPVELTAIYANLDQGPMAWWSIFGADSRRARREFRQALGGVRRAVARIDGAPFEMKVATGQNAADEVLREAARGYDLVAMGVTASAGSDEFLFGSVLDRVVQEAPCPVLVLKAAVEPHREPVRRILVPTAGAEHNRPAVEAASLLAQGARAKVTLLHVLTNTGDVLAGEAMAPNRSREIAEDMIEQQATIVRKLGADVAERIVEAGSPETAILEIAQRESFDLVILGASARSVRSRAYLGPRAEALLRSAPCAVAIVCSG
ncbi:MAG: cation:proton antiporter [Deltaproteobacteria bacterium]|nr:cation:proton antiporter [Deltaproteobacteria bacterium]